MRRQRRGLQLLALILGLSMLAAACGGDDDDDAEEGAGEEEQEIPEGGDLVIGAEQEPECMAWSLSCGGSSWGFWMAGVNTMPTSFEIVQDGDGWTYEPSILLEGEPELEEDPQVVTYQIAEDAVWSDETPITCADYVFTWDHIANGADAYDTTGYRDIESVECPDGEDGKTVVTNYAQPYAGWRSLFGGQFGVFPAHILEGQDLNAAMADGYDWSGGPWIIDHWTKGQEVQLVPNENYWGQVPRLDSVTFRIITETEPEFEAYNSRQVLAIFPQPQVDVIEQIEAGGFENTTVDVQANSPNAEGLWINNEAFPFDSQAVRQAFAYSLDRDAIVAALFGGLGIEEATQSFNAPVLGDFGDPDAFSIYSQDLDMVDELMTEDGWEKNSDGIWEKDGQPARISFKTTAGNARRETTQDLVIEQARDAGFDVFTDNQEAGDLFGAQLPAGDYQMALYAQVLTSLEPSLCSLFCSQNIPSEANQQSGQNWTRTNIPDADAPLAETDANANQEERSEAMAEADALLAESATSIPLDPLPNIFIISDDVIGPKVNNPIWGPFANMEEWGLAG